MSAKLALAVCLCGWLWTGCTFTDSRKHCDEGNPCKLPQTRCYEGFCVAKTDTSLDMRGGRGGRAGGGNGGSAANGGTGLPDGGAAGSDANRPETSTGSCEPNATKACDASWQDATLLGGCGEGMQTCVNGEWGVCVPDRMMIGPESCNRLDDDCDGDVDEDSNVQCFPAEAAGCESTEQGIFNCRAPCKAGTQRCVDGNLGQCSGFTVAALSDNCATEQIDENCDGTPNDNCPCMGNQSQSCYTGEPPETQGRGICVAGRQQCANGRWGTCVGAVTPRFEVCNGDDDDCNGTVDDLVGLGTSCMIAGARGVCSDGTWQCLAGNTALQCVATTQQGAETCNGRDDNCNGTVDDVPDDLVATDPLHCGNCTTVCNAGDKCCAGRCVNSNEDENNCGICRMTCAMNQVCTMGICTNIDTDAGVMCDEMRRCAADQRCCDGRCVPSVNNCVACGMACTGTAPACCHDMCVNLNEPSNCGACDNVCRAQDGGPPCTCATTSTPPGFECRNGPAACQ